MGNFHFALIVQFSVCVLEGRRDVAMRLDVTVIVLGRLAFSGLLDLLNLHAGRKNGEMASKGNYLYIQHFNGSLSKDHKQRQDR